MAQALNKKMSEVVQRQPTPVSDEPAAPPRFIGHNNWTNGLFSCFSDTKSCLLGLLCLPCAVCNVALRTEECCCMPFCVPGGTILMRSKIRESGGIKGSACNDCVVMTCCCPCGIDQMERELDNLKTPSPRFGYYCNDYFVLNCFKACRGFQRDSHTTESQ